MNEFERLIDDLDPTQGGPLTTLTNPERHDVARFIEQLRLWGKYNMIMTDLSPFLTKRLCLSLEVVLLVTL